MTGISAHQPTAREVALGLLQAVLRRSRPLDEALVGDEGVASLSARDRAFARLIVATALRRLGQIDDLIAHCLDRPLPVKAAAAHDILRIGIAQLAFLGTPPHAAVDSTVALAETRHGRHYKGLVNAVLRRIAREGAERTARHDAARLDTPDWLWRSWAASYGEKTCRAIAEAHLGEAPLDITVRADAASWAERLDARLLPTGTLRRAPGGPVTELPGFDDGAWWVQDAAAALPARLVIAGLGGDAAGKRIADLCAAPGGKTAQLAAAGADVTALDRSEARLERLRDNLARLNLGATAIAGDVERWRADAPFDAVLLDAPCTATGTIRRHPDIAHLKSPADVERLAALQARLLDAAAAMVAPGGVLVYSVCSLQKEEGPDRIRAFLAAGAPFTRVPVAPDEIGGLTEPVTTDGDLLTLPCHLAALGGLDGFYAARLRRNSIAVE